ncbi:DgyrCDS3180 [Dimorphilus gyrociliatus]|uniref:DgyrCDS3180 n=1 Tax=Dimorphilus gyrociliatus TaxID=2664684 RepID=A0A7I8VCE0_9ANNE|nr:DgyrCDS3180 [Dimorphilus gyrociliatus]
MQLSYSGKSTIDTFLDNIRNIKNGEQANYFTIIFRDHYFNDILPILKNEKNKLRQFLTAIIENPFKDICKEFFEDCVERSQMVNIQGDADLFLMSFNLMYMYQWGNSREAKEAFGAIGTGYCQLIKNNIEIPKIKTYLNGIVEKAFDFNSVAYQEACSQFLYELDWKDDFRTFHNILKKLRRNVERNANLFYSQDSIVWMTQLLIEKMDACNSKSERFKELTDSYGNLFNACYGNNVTNK